jgi:diguanylate cyclase (GGDEF)-like protein
MIHFSKWFYNLQIAYKLRLVIWLITLAALLISGTLLIVNTRVTLKHVLVNRLITQGDIIAANCTALLIAHDRRAAAEALSALSADKGVMSAKIFLKDGELLADYHKKIGVAKQTDVFSIPLYQFTENTLLIKRPVILQGDVLGYVVIEHDLNEMNRKLWFSISIISVFLLGIAFLAFLMATLLQRGITRPILKLANLARRVAQEQDYSIRAESFGQDEIGMLTQHFNEMLEQIQIRDKRLETYNRELEETVVKRTGQLENLNRKLEHQVQHDILTQLPNRVLFDDRLKYAIFRADRNKEKVALLFVDLDYFKQINDSFGHEAGDHVLLQVAKRLEECVRGEDTVARFAGDEFILLLSGLSFMIDVNVVAAKIAVELTKPIPYKSFSLNISASIGVAVYPDDANNAEMLLKAADVAMYHAKNRGRNRYQFYSSEMNKKVGERINLEAELHQALLEDEFELYFQPLVDLKTQQICSLETLLRWRHPQMGLLKPEKFLTHAEETGLITVIDEWMLSKVCKQIRNWQDRGYKHLHVRVNLAKRDFLQKDFFDVFFTILNEAKVLPEHLSVEIKEQVLMDETPSTIELLQRLRKSCIQLSVDDFGTGYTSLYTLQRCPVDFVKIDSSYINEINADNENCTMIRAIIAMAHSLNLKVIAEGVETETQVEFLKQLDCDMGQGYLFYKPLPVTEVERLILCNDD